LKLKCYLQNLQRKECLSQKRVLDKKMSDHASIAVDGCIIPGGPGHHAPGYHHGPTDHGPIIPDGFNHHHGPTNHGPILFDHGPNSSHHATETSHHVVSLQDMSKLYGGHWGADGQYVPNALVQRDFGSWSDPNVNVNGGINVNNGGVGGHIGGSVSTSNGPVDVSVHGDTSFNNGQWNNSVSVEGTIHF
jgi:hypothetical protein